MEQKKINKIAVIALIFALIGLSQTTAVSNALNYTFHEGSNISIIDDGLGNITISSTVGSNKVNKSGDTMSGNLNMGFNSISNVANLYIGGISPYLASPNSLTFYSTYSLLTWFNTVPFRITYLNVSDNEIRATNQTVNYNLLEIPNNLNLKVNKTDLNNSIQINESQVNNLTSDLDLKVNKSGDTMNGALNNTTLNDQFMILSSNTGAKVGSTGALDIGAISYEFYTVGKVYNPLTYTIINGTYPDRMGFQMQTQVSGTTLGERVFYYNTNSSAAKEIRRLIVQNITNFADVYYYNTNLTLSNLSGTGNAYACLDSTGKFYRSSTACS